jgi:hypothetical protein
VHKEKTVNAEFYKLVMELLLKRIQWVHPDVVCSRDFFLFNDNAPADTAALANF